MLLLPRVTWIRTQRRRWEVARVQAFPCGPTAAAIGMKRAVRPGMLGLVPPVLRAGITDGSSDSYH